MRSTLLTISLIIISSFSRGGLQSDTVDIPTPVMQKAVQKTDVQIDSIFTSPHYITFKDIDDKFTGVTSHMDSLNATIIILLEKIDKERKRGDSAILLSIQARRENRELEKQNTSLSKTKLMAKTASNVLFLFTVTLASSLVAHGMFRGRRKRKENGE